MSWCHRLLPVRQDPLALLVFRAGDLAAREPFVEQDTYCIDVLTQLNSTPIVTPIDGTRAVDLTDALLLLSRTDERSIPFTSTIDFRTWPSRRRVP